MSFEYFQELAYDFEKLLITEIGYDVVIYAGENENGKELHAHSNILCTRSQYFCTAFSNEWAEKENGKFIFKKPNISPQLFEIILRFIYCGKIDLSILQVPEMLGLLIAVDELNIQTLIPCIQKYLIKHQDKFLQQNLITLLETVYQHELFTDLWNYCLEKICEKPEMLFNSDKFINLKAPLLELVLKLDDLKLDEIVIWDKLLKWGLAQNPSISRDIKKLNNEEITIMERNLHRFIPLIRFYHISSDDFLDKIYPLKKLLPEDLFNDLTIFYIAPNRKSNVAVIQPPRKPKSIYESVSIETKHFAIFASWIDKRENLHYNMNNIPYSFNLLYSSSWDGDTATAFHAKCDNKGPTIVVVKIKNSNKIIGGYNPFSWYSDGSYRSTKNSFIFLFTDKDSLQSAKVSYSYGDAYSICGHFKYGPIFGGGWDSFWHSPHKWYYFYGSTVSYPNLNGMPTGEVFGFDDYVVFQVIKN